MLGDAQARMLTLASYNKLDRFIQQAPEELISEALKSRPQSKTDAKEAKIEQNKIALQVHLEKELSAGLRRDKIGRIRSFLIDNSDIVPRQFILDRNASFERLFATFKTRYTLDSQVGLIQFKSGLLGYFQTLENEFHETEDDDFDGRTVKVSRN